MGDCHLPLAYTNSSSVPKTDEKYCKFLYSTWCPTCERNSPRRRSKSETSEPCRRKCKEMKSSSSPRKYTRSHEYENMDMEYETKDYWLYEPKENYRIRSNLVELPTSYITNNYQTSKLPPPVDERNAKTHDQNNFRIAPDHKTNKHEELFAEALNKQTRKLLLGYKSQPSNSDNQFSSEIYNAKFGFAERDYDTGTYFDKILDAADIHDRYTKEMEGMRQKLTDWRRMDSKKSAVDVEPSRHEAVRPNLYDFTRFHDRYVTDRISIKRPLESWKHPPVRHHLELAPGSHTNSFKTIDNVMVPEVKILHPFILPQSSSSTVPKQQEKPRNETIKSESGRSTRKIVLKTRPKSAIKLKKPKVNKTSVLSEIGDHSGTDNSNSDSEEDLSAENESENISENVSSTSTDAKKSDTECAISLQGGGDTSAEWPVRPSLFPNIPPYIRFTPHDAEVPATVPLAKKLLKWKLSTITPIVVRKTLTNSGFSMVRKSNQWLGTWGKHMKSPIFKTLKETQKLNHFPGTFQLGRKDRLWRNFQKLINRHGYKEFGFIPQTFILPQELKLLKQNWEYKNGVGSETWIIKPPASARGVGIKVINKWSQLPKKISLVVQKYISNPYLINGSKFDLRLYVLVTSFNPLRIYLYPEGLARFASVKYSDSAKDLKDRYMHLTNYSINKLSSQYAANEDANACQGHKWTLTKLLEYLGEQGVDTKALWINLQQLVIKTIITAEAPINQLCEENMSTPYNCYELFGIDVLLDEYLKPWLLEVNISPSLHSASPLDAHVKGPMVHTLFDLAQFHFPPRLAKLAPRQSPQCYDPKIYTTALTKKEREKHNLFLQYERRPDYLDGILTKLTGDDVRKLCLAEDEFTVMGRFERIFPTSQTCKYLSFMEPRYYNRLFDAWEVKYEKNRDEGIELLKGLCSEKLHLKVASQNTLVKNSPSTTPVATNLQPSKEGQTRPLNDIMQEVTIESNPSCN